MTISKGIPCCCITPRAVTAQTIFVATGTLLIISPWAHKLVRFSKKGCFLILHVITSKFLKYTVLTFIYFRVMFWILLFDSWGITDVKYFQVHSSRARSTLACTTHVLQSVWKDRFNNYLMKLSPYLVGKPLLLW